jgi:glycosyltransferase involved in cell wall biosynthesis
VKTVLIFSWFYLPYLGGAELFVREIVSRLSDRYRFVIVTVRGEKRPVRLESDGGAEIIRVGLGGRLDKLLYPIPALARALQLGSVDVVHAVMVNASALSAALYCWWKDKPAVLTLQSGDSEEYVRGYLGPLFPLYPRLHRSFERVHAISRHLRDEAVRYGVDPARISIIPNGVDTGVFSRSAYSPAELDSLRAQLGLEGKRIIISASRLSITQRMSDLLRAMPAIAQDHPDAVALLVGEGEDRPALERLASELSLEDRIVFLGAKEHEQVARYLCLADVFVRPSVTEGLGTAFLEALACEVPIVGTPVGGIPDFLEEGRTGLFCQPGNPESIATAVNRLLSDRELARGCGVRGKAMVEASYQWDAVAERIAALYEELLHSGAP